MMLDDAKCQMMLNDAYVEITEKMRNLLINDPIILLNKHLIYGEIHIIRTY